MHTWKRCPLDALEATELRRCLFASQSSLTRFPSPGAVRTLGSGGMITQTRPATVPSKQNLNDVPLLQGLVFRGSQFAQITPV
jgi:hypothetical protein